VAVLLVMERLSPAERVAFVLHYAFGMSFTRIGVVVGRTPVACRQLASRARRRIRSSTPAPSPSRAGEREGVLAAFFAASACGDVTSLIRLLDPSVVLRTDGGGVVPAACAVVLGPAAVAGLLAGLGRLYPGASPARSGSRRATGSCSSPRGALIGVLALEMSGGMITELNLIVNPAKLAQVEMAFAEPRLMLKPGGGKPA
jgi:RNA polymerase sigma-70 factor (ECF subfamily)